MSNPTSTAVKEVNHCNEAIDFGKEYLAKKQPEKNYETEYEGDLPISRKVELDIPELVREMSRARGVLDDDNEDDWGPLFMDERVGFEIAILLHMQEKGHRWFDAKFYAITDDLL